MKILIAAVGRLKEPHWRDAVAEYAKRLKPYATVQVVEVPDRDVEADEERAVRSEGEALLRAIPDGAHLIALDLGGASLTSEEFAARVERHMIDGRSTIAFAIGGAAGLDADVLARADERLALGPMTLPHQLARVVLFEQIYRAFRIIRGEPYHR